MLRHFIAAGTFVVSASAAMSAPVAITGEQSIKETVAGALLEVDTPLGTKLPVRYSPDGQMSGQASGTLSFFLGASSDTGRWWVSRDRLCHKWSRWFDRELQCLRLHQEGSRIHWRRDDGETGTATIVTRPDPSERFAQAPYALGAERPQVEKPAPAVPRIASVAPPSHSAAPARALRADPPAKPAAAPPSTAAASQPQKRTAATQVQKKSQQKQQLALAAPQPAARPASPPPESPPVAVTSRNVALETSFRVAGVRYDDVLNVRNGPSTEHGIVGFIQPEGRGVKLAGPCVQEWCMIVHRGLKGWVNRYYLAEETTVRASAWPAWTSRDLR